MDWDKFPVFFEDQLLATVSLRTSIEGTATATQARLFAKVPEAHIDLPDTKRRDTQSLERPKDIVLVQNGAPLTRPQKSRGTGGAEAPGGPSAVDYVLELNAPRNLWVKSSDVQGELGLSEGFRVEIQREVSLYGEVRVLRGRADVMGRKFEVQRDSLARFTGDIGNPFVSATAVYNAQKDNIKVFMEVTGQGKNMKLAPRSEPPLSESEIYTLIATGSPTLKHGAGASSPTPASQTVSILGSVVANQLRKTLANKLPLDVLSIEAGAPPTGSTQAIAGSVQAGRYFGDRFYVGYEGRLGADPSRYENRNAVRLEYQFSPRWSAEGQYGDAFQGYLDLLWSKDY
jgi:translocation and assembly module TamB